jgi:hypothetical protein
MKKLFFFAVLSLLTSWGFAQKDDVTLAMNLVKQSKEKIGLTDQDLKNIIVSNSYFDVTGKVQLVYLQQAYQDLPVYNQLQVLAFKGNQLVSQSGGRIPGIEKRTGGHMALPKINASQALVTALKSKNIDLPLEPLVLSSEKNGHYLVYDNMNIMRENITAELIWVPLNDGKKIELCWQIYFIPKQTSDYWMVRVSAITNTVVDFNNLNISCDFNEPSAIHEQHASAKKRLGAEPKYNAANRLFDFPVVNEQVTSSTASPNLINNATYRVIPFPAESPIHGGTPATRTNPWTAAPGNATTLNWHNNGLIDFTYTRGNNVWAQEDRNGNNGTGLPANSTTAADPLSFDYAPNFTVTPTQTTPTPNQQFNTTNLFYWNNIIHDVMYQYGFDEVSGNFQASNLGRGGQENDFVYADAQDGSGTNNANFATPADGGNGRMQMYLWSGTPQKDGDVDNGIITHEFSHGTSNRLTGGPAQAGCLSNAEQMGEGWSDYYALMFTQNWGTATVNTGFNSPRSIGTYVVGQTPTGTGIRSQRYCTNFAVNNRVYGATIPAQVHDRGEIWCATLWDMTWNIINQVGSITPNLYDAAGTGGNVIALKLVTEGMKLQPCSPGFIDGRNAILQADEILYGGAHRCAIWEAFRRRGMGAFASQGSSGSVTDQVADYTIGSATLQLTQSLREVPEGQQITYYNTVSTDNCGSIANFLLTDTLPTNVTYVSGGTYNAANRVVSFPISMAAGQTQVYTFTVLVNNGSYFPTVSLFQDSANGPIGTYWSRSNTVPAGNWTLSNARSFSPTSSYFANNLDTTSDQRLTLTNAISLGATPPPLTFRHWYSTESTYDGGVLEASTDGGTTWNDMQANILLGGYIATMDATTLLNGRRAWSGSSGNKFIRTKVNLTPYANQSLKVRFRFTSDVGTQLEGWYVDDIAIRSQAVVEMQSNLFNNSGALIGVSDTFTIILPGNACATAAITSPPSNVTVCAGADASFSVSATGSSLNYQWQVSTNGGTTFSDISGASASTYTVAGANSAQNNNRYRVIVSNACPSSVTSSAAILTVSTPPTIITQPVNQTTCAPISTLFSVNANGTNLSYQWQVSTDGGTTFSDIIGATSSSYAISNAGVALNNNLYHVVITGCNPNPLISSNALLTVNTRATITSQPENTNVCPGGNASFTPTYTGSNLTYQWQVSTDGGVTYNDISGANAAALNINGVNASMNNNKYRVVVNSSSCPSPVTSTAATLLISTGVLVAVQPQAQTACDGSSVSFSVSASGSGLTYQWQVSTNGGGSFTDINGANGNTYTFNCSAGSNGYLYQVLMSTACSATAIASDAVGLTVLANPSISIQPNNTTVCAGADAVFSTTATGSNLNYQWQVSNDGGNTFTNISGANSNTLTIANTTTSLNGSAYQLVLSTATCGSITSTPATLNISNPANINVQPSDIGACENSNVSLTISASGSNLSYQWQLSTDGGANFSNISGETNATLNLNNITNAMNQNRYRVIVTEAVCGAVNSSAALLTVNPIPQVSIAASPSNVITQGTSITLTASTTGSGNIFSWYNNNVQISGQNGNSISISSGNGGGYTVTVTDANGCINSSNTITVRDSVNNITFIYPNPNKGQFQVRFEGVPYNGYPRIITMYDAKGARVYRKSYTVTSSYEIMNVNVPQFSSGTYSLVLSDINGTTLATGQVVIQ